VRYNVIDGAVSLVLIYLLLPRFGIAGYLGVIFVSEILNLTLSLRRMLKVTGMRFMFTRWVLLPGAAAAFSVLISRLPGLFMPDAVLSAAGTLLSLALSLVLYVLLLRALGLADVGGAVSLVKTATAK